MGAGRIKELQRSLTLDLGQRGSRGCNALANVVDRILGVLFVLERQRPIGWEFCLDQGVEDRSAVQVALAKDDPSGAFLHLGKIFQVDTVESTGQGSDDIDRFFTRADKVTQVSARTDARIATLDGLEHIDNFVEAVRGAMVMDGDSDVEFFDQIVKAVHRVWSGSGRNILDASLLRKFENLAICLGVFGKAVDTVGRDAKTQAFDLVDHLLDLFVTGRQGEHTTEELDFFEAEVFGVIQGDLDWEPSQGVDLDSEFEASGLGFLSKQTCRWAQCDRAQCDRA